MAENETKGTTPDASTARAPAKQVSAEAKQGAAPRATRIVEETGRYVCKTQITYSNDKGERAQARRGDVVVICAEDAKHLKRVGAIVEETREE